MNETEEEIAARRRRHVISQTNWRKRNPEKVAAYLRANTLKKRAEREAKRAAEGMPLCLQCKTPFMPYNVSSRYCGDGCRSKAKRKREAEYRKGYKQKPRPFRAKPQYKEDLFTPEPIPVIGSCPLPRWMKQGIF